MKCLEKDRNRRYETANGLARDIERYLHDEPVQACPPSASYRFRKFARGATRRRRFVILLAGMAAWRISNIATKRERDAENYGPSESASAKAVSDLLQEMLGSADAARPRESITRSANCSTTFPRAWAVN